MSIPDPPDLAASNDDSRASSQAPHPPATAPLLPTSDRAPQSVLWIENADESSVLPSVRFVLADDTLRQLQQIASARQQTVEALVQAVVTEYANNYDRNDGGVSPSGQAESERVVVSPSLPHNIVQREIVEFVGRFLNQIGRGPTASEIAKAVRIPKAGKVMRYTEPLVNEGYLVRSGPNYEHYLLAEKVTGSVPDRDARRLAALAKEAGANRAESVRLTQESRHLCRESNDLREVARRLKET